jgi:VIT1/CCC1 family predicted Fe2+/Mn2+ transporter
MGASDGLISNFNLTMGVAGAAVGNKYVLLTGLSGLLAGAISMAIGEWISVHSSEELYQHQMDTERAEFEHAPEEELEELVVIYKARGMTESQALATAQAIFQDKEKAIQTLVSEEVGADAIVEEGSAWEAALTSFVLFSIGAIIPVLPYFFFSNTLAIGISVIMSVLGLFLLGAVITVFTGKSIWYSGIRQVFIGCLAAFFTFAIGHFIGVSING